MGEGDIFRAMARGAVCERPVALVSRRFLDGDAARYFRYIYMHGFKSYSTRRAEIAAEALVALRIVPA